MSRKRRGRGEGCIYQVRSGLWRAEVALGYDEKGKRRKRAVYAKSKQEVRVMLRELQCQAESGLLIEPTRLKLGEYLKHWLEVAARPSVRDNTYVNYEIALRVHVYPHLGGVSLPKIQPSMVQALYTRLEKNGFLPRTRENVHAVLHRALKQAVKWGYLNRNVCDFVDKPRSRKKESPVV